MYNVSMYCCATNNVYTSSILWGGNVKRSLRERACVGVIEAKTCMVQSCMHLFLCA